MEIDLGMDIFTKSERKPCSRIQSEIEQIRQNEYGNHCTIL